MAGFMHSGKIQNLLLNQENVSTRRHTYGDCALLDFSTRCWGEFSVGYI